ncbi:Bifunctional DNA primase/polymerase, N-terminal [Micromonospora nigra]|uniref:Bifunctional DNA primase/polymerase, N-terminal n=1 Tax=Micromonospora nigra TaxID=145857 RepID=A0A1C6R7F2_9ACTN|nr:bifunctional DNA primase/polymerase [Micromonospora nigra]SCL12951.1 Bifunctional DNA primase/polymerase, N-terminal [Micromonospora nigra]
MSSLSAGLAAALARGLAVFPIPAGARKAPPGWQALVSRDPGPAWPIDSNVGVGCRASGIVVLDLDRKNGVDGVAGFAGLLDQQGCSWPVTFTVATPSGGQHLYFAAPPGRVIVSTIGVLGPGIDVRAPGRLSGGYVVGPGSIVGDRPYLVDKDLRIAPLPDSLVRLLCLRPTRIRRGAKTGDVHATVDRPPAGTG